MILMSVKNDPPGSGSFGSFRIHGFHHKNTFNTGTTSRKGMGEIGCSIIIPNRCRVNKAFTFFHQDMFLPWAFAFFGFHHIYPKSWSSPLDVKSSLMVPERRSPNPVAVLWFAEMIK